MLRDYKTSSFHIHDSGLNLELALALAKQGVGRVTYWSPWHSAFPSSMQTEIGEGIPSIERVSSLAEVRNETDCFCFDDQTEIMTEHGWRLFSRLKPAEKVTTLNPTTDCIEFQKPLQYISYPYKGDLISINTGKLNFAVTPNHRMYVRQQRKKVYELIAANEVFNKSNVEFKRTASWRGELAKEIVIPTYKIEFNTSRRGCVHRTKNFSERKFPADSFCALIGIWLAEGSVSSRYKNHPSCVEIGQNEGLIADKIRQLLGRLKIKYTESKKGNFVKFRIHNSQLANYFSFFGKSVQRHIPQNIKILSRKLLKNLFMWYMMGDGSKTGRDFRTISQQLCHDLQEIALKIGACCTESLIEGSEFMAPNGKKYINKKQYAVSVGFGFKSPRIQDRKRWEKINYDGIVYCVSVPNKIIYVRRQKKAGFWCGNCFPDIYFWADQLELQDSGERVFGSRDADKFERFRDDAKKHFQKLGIPQGPWRPIKGIKKLRAFLEANPGKKYWIKIDDTRGDSETFPVEGYELFKGRIDELEFKLGPKAEITKFTVEDDLPDTLDLAIDTHSIDGKYPSVALLGTEEKGELYVGVVKPWNEMPLKLLDIYDKMAPTLGEYGYRNFISLESRVKGNVVNLGDPCMRAGSPPGELQYKMIKNLPDIFWFGAEGKVIDPEYDGKYGVELCVHSDWGNANPLMVEFPEKYRDNIKFRYFSEFDGKVWILPQQAGPRIAAIVSNGNNLDDCFAECEEVSKQIKGIQIETFVSAIPLMKEKLKTFKEECGITF